MGFHCHQPCPHANGQGIFKTTVCSNMLRWNHTPEWFHSKFETIKYPLWKLDVLLSSFYNKYLFILCQDVALWFNWTDQKEDIVLLFKKYGTFMSEWMNEWTGKYYLFSIVCLLLKDEGFFLSSCCRVSSRLSCLFGQKIKASTCHLKEDSSAKKKEDALDISCIHEDI